jgi:hypothetical protein
MVVRTVLDRSFCAALRKERIALSTSVAGRPGRLDLPADLRWFDVDLPRWWRISP